jgi:hypothetical protein
LASIYRGDTAAVCAEANPAPPQAILSGSFNPFHDGHRQLAAAASRWLRVEVAFELTIVNADKPPIPSGEAERRLQPMLGVAPIWLTTAPTFAERAALFPNVWWVVGFDTAARVLDPRFYGSAERRDQALERIRSFGGRFLVGGRCHGSGEFQTLAQLTLPVTWHDLFEGLPEAAFRCDVSSTAIRSRRG